MLGFLVILDAHEPFPHLHPSRVVVIVPGSVNGIVVGELEVSE